MSGKWDLRSSCCDGHVMRVGQDWMCIDCGGIRTGVYNARKANRPIEVPWIEEASQLGHAKETRRRPRSPLDRFAEL